MTNLLTILNSMGDKFCEFSLTMLVQSSILIIVLFIADLLLRKHVRAVFRYCIWMLLFAKLMLPATLSSPISIGQLMGDKLAINQTQTMPEPIAHTEIAPMATADYTPAVQTIDPAPLKDVPAPQPVTPVISQVAADPLAVAITWQAIVFIAWLVGDNNANAT